MEKTFVLILCALLCAACASAPKPAVEKRSVSTLEQQDFDTEKVAPEKALKTFVAADLSGARAGFARTANWHDLVIESEAPGWDTLTIVKSASAKIISMGDEQNAIGQITYDQLGELSADGSFVTHKMKKTITVEVLVWNDQWRIHSLPEDLLPQVTKDAMLKHLRALLKKSRVGSLYIRKSIAALQRIK